MACKKHRFPRGAFWFLSIEQTTYHMFIFIVYSIIIVRCKRKSKTKQKAIANATVFLQCLMPNGKETTKISN